MGFQAWMIKSWPVCEWYLPNSQTRWPAFQHAGTQIRPDLDGDGRRIGETFWFAEVGGIEAAAAWEWTEFQPGVVVLSNPNCVATNLQLFNADHQALHELEEIVALNSIVHSLPWREPVCAALQSARKG